MWNFVIRMPVSLGYGHSVALEPNLADSAVASKYREALFVFEIPLWIARLNIRICLEKAALHDIEPGSDAFFRVRGLAR